MTATKRSTLMPFACLALLLSGACAAQMAETQQTKRDSATPAQEHPFELLMGETCVGQWPDPVPSQSAMSSLPGLYPGKLGFRERQRQQLAERASPELDRALSVVTEALIAAQSQDGWWPISCAADEPKVGDVAATSLTLLALLGQGLAPDFGPHREVMSRGLKWLRTQQNRETGQYRGPLNHALATLAIADAYNATKSPLLKYDCKRALEAIEASASPDGGWRVDPAHPSPDDVLLTAWNLSAISMAKEAALDFPSNVLEEARAYLESITDPVTGLVDPTGERRSAGTVPRQKAMTAAALFARMILLESDPPDKHGLERALRTLANASTEEVDSTSLFFTANALFQAGGATWLEAERGLHKHLATLTEPTAESPIAEAALRALTQEISFRLRRSSEIPPRQPKDRRTRGDVIW